MRTLLRIFFIFVFLSCSATPLWAANIKEVFEQATQAFADGNLDHAADLYEKIIEAAPTFAPAYHYLGLVHKAKGTSGKDVLWLFEKAAQVDPNYAPAYENLGKTYYAMGDYDKAEEYSLKAVQLNPNLMNAQLALGWIYLLGKSDPDKAIHFFKIVADQQKSPFAYYGLGMAYFMDGKSVYALDSITALRGLGKEDLASELEKLVRSHNYVPMSPTGAPLPLPKKEDGSVVDNAQVSADEGQDERLGELRVYLRGRMPGADPYPTDPENQTSAKDLDRLKALQQKRGVGVPVEVK